MSRPRPAAAPEPRVPYQYVVLRCVPRVEREEFVNVGVLLYCQERDFLGTASNILPVRLGALAPEVDTADVASALRAIDAVCRATDPDARHVGTSAGQRFGWLAAPRSTVVQPGPVHGGVTADPARELERLVEILVA